MKSYTSLEQSKKLAEFLPLESADMVYNMVNGYNTPWVRIEGIEGLHKEDVCAWSLTALMSTFPKEKDSCTSLSFGYYDTEGNYISSWICCYEKEGEFMNDYILEIKIADNPVDACYEMILKLHELKML